MNPDPGLPPYRPNPPQPTSPRPFQFSLLTLLIVTTLVALLCSALFSMPIEFTFWTIPVLMLLTPMVLVVVLIYGQGYQRTFSIGGLFPAGFMAWFGLLSDEFSRFRIFDSTIRQEEQRLWVAIVVGIGFVAIVVFGLVAMGVRWMVERAYQRQSGTGSHSTEPLP